MSSVALSGVSTFLADLLPHLSAWLGWIAILGLPGDLAAGIIASSTADITRGEPFWVFWLAAAINALIYFLPLLGIVKLVRLLRGQAR